MITRDQFYGVKEPRDAPVYGVAEAAHHLHLPPSTIRSWIAGTAYQTKRGKKRSPALIEASRKRPWLLSFWNLVELQVLASIRRDHKVSMRRVRDALDFVESELLRDRPLVTAEFSTDGLDRFVDHYGHLLNASKKDMQGLTRHMRASLDRIERDERGLASRFFPWAEDPFNDLRVVSVDPLTAFGRPVIRGTRIPTEVLADRRVGGDTAEALAEEYGLPAESVITALRWELGPQAA